VNENIDRFSEVAQWQLFFTLFAALAMKVNMDNENLQNRAYFDIVLSAIQFVPILIVTVTNFINARNATKAAKSLLGGSSNDDSGGGGLEMGEITLNPGGSNMGEGARRGSEFSSDNPMHVEAESGEGRRGKKKEDKSLFKRFENEMLRRSYERQLKNKPVDTRVVRQQQYEDPIPGPPPPKSQQKSPTSVNTRVVRQQQYEDPIPGPPPAKSQQKSSHSQPGA
jgi:hypothetical protein